MSAKIAKPAKPTTKPAPFVIGEGDEDFTINTASGQTHAIVPFKPVLSAKRELYRDRLTKAQAKVTADKILAALNA